MISTTVGLWIGFSAFVLIMLILDLGVFHRRAHATSLREAGVWTVVWVILALLFSAVIYWQRGRVATVEFLTGYIIEWSLSMDNVFVFAVIFSYFAVPPQYQHRVLFWGILGAVVMRLTFILVGAALLERFHWLIYPMGAFLVLTGLRLLFKQEGEADLSKNWVVRTVRRWLPVTSTYVGQKFFVRVRDGVIPAEPGSGEADLKVDPANDRQLPFLRGLYATPLLLVLLVVETTDVAFAVDSIPAIFAVTRDPFIVFTSNVFAILGLRALYFLLAGAMQLFRYLNVGLAAILCFVGVKMLISGWFHIPIGISLGIVASVLILSVLVSLWAVRVETRSNLKNPSDRNGTDVPESCVNVEAR